MAVEQTHALAPAIEMVAKTRKPSAAERVFRSMREKIESVFPETDAEAWSWTGEDFASHEITPPETDFKTWLAERYEGSDEFIRRLVRRMFTIWDGMEREGFVANDKELYEHQKALFAWIAISTATGVREEIANLLVRSPYGSGKSLVSGLVVRAFRETQEELLAEGHAENAIPTGILLGLRKEHMLQNAMGKQYAVLQPPYTVERQDIAVYWRNLHAMFGEDFAGVFKKPAGKAHPFYDLFNASEDEGAADAATRVSAYLERLDGPQKEKWESLARARRKDIVDTLGALIDGKIILIPDVYKVPRAEQPLPREEESGAGAGYKGDSAHALVETPSYRVKATHKHLALDRSTYTTEPNLEHPAQFAIAYGTMVTRATEDIRADVREEIMKRTRGMFIDEAGAYTPLSLGDSASELSGEWPYIVGFTGQDRGTEGWTSRSPTISVRKMVELGLMKPIAFQGIGDPSNPPAQGTEEAWNAYKAEMFTDVRTATALKLPQPHELDTVVVAPSAHVREYAHRILEAHAEAGMPVKVWCFDPAAGDSKWSMVVNGFNAPKNEGDPRRILVSPPSQMSEALHLHAECYDILANVNTFSLDQTRGRLGHIRNDETGPRRETARTYFRVQWLDGARGEPYIREVAKMMGYALPEENATWRPLHDMIDKASYERDAKRRNLSEPVPIADAAAVAKRKRKGRTKTEWTPLEATSPFVIEVERKKAERKREKHEAVERALNGTRPPSAAATDVSDAKARAFGFAKGAPSESGEFTAGKGKQTITLVIGANGAPTNLDELANRFGVGSYKGSLSLAVRDAQAAGLTGTKLAEAALAKLLSLCEKADSRAKVKSTDEESGGRMVGSGFARRF